MTQTNHDDTSLHKMKLRIWGALKIIDVNHEEVADLVSKSPRTIEKYKARRSYTFFTVRNLAKVCRAYNINVHWVLYGEEPIFTQVPLLGGLAGDVAEDND